MDISRSELISAAAHFGVTIVADRSRVRAEDECPRLTYLIDAWPQHCFAKVMAGDSGFRFDGVPDTNMADRLAAVAFNDVRQQLAECVREFDTEACDALQKQWSATAECAWPHPESAKKSGICLDALLYSAAQKRCIDAVEMYLVAGANPLATTHMGDCAARIGVANGLLGSFSTPEYLNARVAENGETGLFSLAGSGDFGLIKAAYVLGADPDIRDAAGRTVLDLIDPAHHEYAEVCAAIADARVRTLRAAVVPASQRVGGRRRSL